MKKELFLEYKFNNLKFSIKQSKFTVLFLLFIILISSCSKPYKDLPKTEYSANDTKEVPYAMPFSEETIIYKTDINLYDNEIDGLLIIKNTDEKIYRIALTTQVGLKIFDYELNHSNLSIKYCMEQLNKTIVTNTLEDVFNLILMQNKSKAIYAFEDTEKNQKIWQFKSGPKTYNYIENINSGKIEYISYMYRKSKKITVDLNNYKKDTPGKIVLEHHRYDLKMNLRLIQ